MDFLFPPAYRFLPTVVVHTGQASGNSLPALVWTSQPLFLHSFFFFFNSQGRAELAALIGMKFCL